MKKRASEALNSSDLLTFRSLEEEEEGFIGVDDDGRLILKSKVKEENGVFGQQKSCVYHRLTCSIDFAFAIVPRGCIDSSGEVSETTGNIVLTIGHRSSLIHILSHLFTASHYGFTTKGLYSLWRRK